MQNYEANRIIELLELLTLGSGSGGGGGTIGGSLAVHQLSQIGIATTSDTKLSTLGSLTDDVVASSIEPASINSRLRAILSELEVENGKIGNVSDASVASTVNTTLLGRLRSNQLTLEQILAKLNDLSVKSELITNNTSTTTIITLLPGVISTPFIIPNTAKWMYIGVIGNQRVHWSEQSGDVVTYNHPYISENSYIINDNIQSIPRGASFTFLSEVDAVVTIRLRS